jgi:hypothetical protein
MTTVSERSGSKPRDEDPWARIDELERVARQYLNEHHHEPPKSLALPIAQWDVIRGRTLLADRTQTKCMARARIETNLYGTLWGTPAPTSSPAPAPRVIPDGTFRIRKPRRF